MTYYFSLKSRAELPAIQRIEIKKAIYYGLGLAYYCIVYL